jgi:hypothetical protein
MTGTGVTVLGFDDRRIVNGSYSVLAVDGTPVAEVTPSFWRSRFEAVDHTDAPLCRGKARLISGWLAFDPAGQQLVKLRVRPLNHHRTTLRGGELECRSIGKAFTGEWYFQATGGRNLLQATGNKGLKYPIDVWTVESDGTLTLAEIVAVVELHRLELKRKRRRHPTTSRLARRRQLPIGRVA